MTTAAQAAHARLLATLPVYTHRRMSVADRSEREAGIRNTSKHRIRIGERTFESITMAKISLGIGLKRIYRMLDTGEASYDK